MPEIIAYGSGEMLNQVFTAISMLMNDQSAHFYKPLLRMGAVVGGLWALSKAFWESSISGLIFHWMIPMAAFVGICLIPSTSITIIDVLARGPLGVARKVDHVPLGLARAAQSISYIGNLVTKAVETAFHAPDHSLYNKTGMIFGAENLLEMSRYAITDEHLADTMREFIHNCVTYDLTLELYSINDLKTAPDIWKLIAQNTSNVRMFSLCTPKAAASAEGATTPQDKRTRCKLVSCKEGTVELGNLLAAYKNKLTANHLLQHLPDFYHQLTGIAKGAQNLISQQIMMHSLIDAIERKCEASGIGTNFAIRRAYLQQRNTYEVVGGLAAKSLVVLRNILEALIYAAFIFIMPFALMPMGFKVFLKWLWLLVWIQLWPPFYAILNSGIMTVTKHQALQIPGIENGLTLLTSTGLHNLALDMQTYAAYASLSIPFLSYAILQGGISTLAQVAGAITSVGQGAGGTAAQDLTTGNYNYGNVQLETLSYGNQTMLQHNLAPSLSTDHYSENFGDQSTTYGKDSMIMNDQKSQLPFTIRASQSYSQSFREAAQRSAEFAESERESLADSNNQTNRQLFDYSRHTANSEHYSKIYSHGSELSVAKLGQKTIEQAETFGQDHGYDAKTSFQILAAAGMSTGKEGFFKSLPNIGVDVKAMSEASAHELYQSAKNFSEKEGFTTNHQALLSAATNQQFNSSDEKGERFSRGIAESTEQSQHFQQQVEKHTQKAHQYSQSADQVEQNSVNIDHVMDQKFVDFVTNQKTFNGQARGRSAAQWLIRNSPQECNTAVRQFLDQERPKFITGHTMPITAPTKENFEKAAAPVLNKSIKVEKNNPSFNQHHLPSPNLLGRKASRTDQPNYKNDEKQELLYYNNESTEAGIATKIKNAQNLKETHDHFKTDIRENHHNSKTNIEQGTEEMKETVEHRSKQSSAETALGNVQLIKPVKEILPFDDGNASENALNDNEPTYLPEFEQQMKTDIAKEKK